MGAGEECTPAKPSRPTSTLETPTTPSYPDWPSPMQAYYGAGATTPPFFTSTVASPTPHPYLWGSQHHLIPPYGTPLPYPTLYPHGGIYAHPNIAVAQGAALTNTEMEGKAPDRKDRASTKKSKGSSGNTGLVGGKSGESGNASSGSGNDGASQSAESGSEGSSDGSDDNTNKQGFSATKKRSFDQMLADGANAQNSDTAQYGGANLPVSVPGKPAVPMPVTNLNIGMDLWNASPGSVPMKGRPNASGVSPAVAPATMDERELKRQKRKQSNRESARRSRLRKQAECEVLQVKVETLSNENHTLRDELQRLSEECEKLTSENNSIMDELTQLHGPDAISTLEGNNPTPILHSVDGEGNCNGKDTSRGNSSVSSHQNGNFSNSNGKFDSGSN